MKLLGILKEVISTPAMKALIYKLEDAGWRRVGQGDWGIVLEKGEQVKKITTDPLEIEHAEKLLGHISPYIIPILGLQRISDRLAILDMPNAMEIGNDEKNLIAQAGTAAEDYIVYDEEDALESVPESLRDFVAGLKKAFTDAGIETDEIDWSPYNIMKYKGNYVLVDV
jgi:hypothetical protein